MLATALALLSAAALIPLNVSAQQPRQSRKLFDVELTSPVAKLLETVEGGFRKPLREELVNNWEPSHYGECTIDPDGTPVIRLNAATGRTLPSIAHELFHLKLKSEGFPALVFELPPGTSTESNRTYLQWLGFHLRDPIEHWMFYPEMQRMGVDPDRELKAEFEQALRNDAFLGLRPATERETLALYYLKAILQLGDADLLSRITKWYERKGWTGPLEKGRELQRLVTEEAPRSPQAEISVFVRCMNSLLADTARFEGTNWGTERLGSFVLQTVTIRVLPPSRAPIPR